MLKNIFKNWLKNCVIFSIFFCFFVSAHAAESVCQPYSIPLAPVACDAGYTGKKFPMRTKTCPDGKITDGLTFDYSNCKPAGRENVDLNATDCSITPTAVGCMPVPTLSGCPVGKHWTLAGSKIAHCVNNDPVCPWGTSLTHDFLGEPSCIANTCPSNQVLQSDGISCACPASLPVWNGSSCVAPVCNSYISNANAYCPAGQTGYITNQNTYDCNNNLLSTVEIANTCVTPVSCPGPTTQYTACPVGQTGQMLVTTNYTMTNGTCTSSVTTDSSGCSTTPVSCTPNSFTQTGACPAGQTGTATRTATQNCDGTTTYGAWDTSACAVVCPANSVTTGACPSPQIGNTTITTTYSGPACTPTTTTDSSACYLTPNTICPNPEQFCTYKLASGGDAIWTLNTVTYSGVSCSPTTTTQGLGRYPDSVEPQECGGPPPGCNDSNGVTLPVGSVRNICETDLVVNVVIGVRTQSRYQCTSPGFWNLIYQKPGDEITVCP